MKKKTYAVLSGFVIAAMFGVFAWEKTDAHVPRERLLPVLLTRNEQPSIPAIQFGTTTSGAGTILKINGLQAFTQYVLQRSINVPVVLNVCSEHSKDGKKIDTVFREVAAAFDGKVSCVMLDLFAFHENFLVVNQLMMQENILKLELPLFMFFKNGNLYRTDAQPAAILQGFYTQENLGEIITKTFFS